MRVSGFVDAMDDVRRRLLHGVPWDRHPVFRRHDIDGRA